ncbi:2-amino-4-hydroxy-6-hydroxymethyldihydropteridine diphosphokinase [Paracoccus sp. (in: a-proteobacteria)]|uniref:2-amino-4-hydroxy-6- hydroxymethyldihydropteridine diphosphokinase n=1 Tax=Paracoccus sp. TaxID=267 RepID=UPI0035B32076
MENLSFGIIALGGNLPTAAGDPSHVLHEALAILHAEPDISIAAVSRVWRTPAFPPGSGPEFANAVATIRTILPAPDLLARLHGIEARLGRDRSTGRWSARVLDLDLIALDDLVLPDAATVRDWIALPLARQRVETPGCLILPHPRMQDRGFVLAPLAEIAPGWRHPLTGKTVSRMLAELDAEDLKAMTPLPPGTGLFLP